MKYPISKRLHSLIKMRTALNVAFEKNRDKVDYEKPETWPTTRELAESCDMNIYQARRFLLKLVAQGEARVSEICIDRSRRWCAISRPSAVSRNIWGANDGAGNETTS